MHMCVRVLMSAFAYAFMYICMFFVLQWVLHALWNRCSGHQCMCRCVLYTGVFWHQRTDLPHTRCRMCTYVYVHIYVYTHAYVYGCVCAPMILLDALRHLCWDFLSVNRCAYTCICRCVCMYACICTRVYVCIRIYVCLCICMHIHVLTHTCGCTYAL